jgi:2-polyprenyl-6-methoxyphenol hydroxylase-like FAD-dependent oxidoreductase
MPEHDYDIIAVGGGLGGSALAKAMAEHGHRVLVLEREREFKDRVRGEWIAPWGVAEAKELGIFDLLLRECAITVDGWDSYLGEFHLGHRDFPSSTPQALPSVTFSHPEMQEALLRAASAAGAEVRRGATMRTIEPGARPVVTFESDGRTIAASARIVIGADGRTSLMRTAAQFEVRRDPTHLFLAGVMLEGLAIPSPFTSRLVLNPEKGLGAFLVPVGRDRCRAYLVLRADTHERLQGSGEVTTFIELSVAAGARPEWYAGARVIGPLASFDGADNWVDHPYRDGVALIGDAAAASDPTHGQGQSLTLRDVRVLRDQLLSQSDWDAAGHAYAVEHDRYYSAMHRAEGWFATVFFAGGAEAEARRARALPLIGADLSRVPDFQFSGPEVPLDDSVRRRFYGEE